MEPQATNPATRTTVTVGHVIGGSFGMVFIIANSAPMPAVLRVAFVAVAVAVMVLTLLAFGRAVRDGSLTKPERGERLNRGFWAIVAVEAVALFGGLTVLNQWRASAAVGWVALVVGLHFFWLAHLWTSGSREISLIASSLTVLGLTGLVIAAAADSPDAVALVAGVGSGVVLLASSLAAALESLFAPRSPG